MGICDLQWSDIYVWFNKTNGIECRNNYNGRSNKLIIFYNNQTGLCIRTANGISRDVTVTNNRAFYKSDLLVADMTNISYTDIIDQEITTYDTNMIPSPKLFSELKQGVPDEVKIAAMQDAIIALSGV